MNALTNEYIYKAHKNTLSPKQMKQIIDNNYATAPSPLYDMNAININQDTIKRKNGS